MSEPKEKHNRSPQKRKFKLGRFLKRLAVSLLILIAVILGAGFFIANKYQDEVKALVVAKVNEQLNSRIIVLPADIRFSVFENFPKASVTLRNVKMLDAIQAADNEKDTLLNAGLISLQFNISDLYHKHYVIKHLTIKDVKLNLWVDKKGEDNFHILKPAIDTATGAVRDTNTFALNKIVLKNISVKYKDDKANSDYEFTLRKATLTGQFSSENYTLKTDLELFVEHVANANITYIQNRTIDLSTELDVIKKRFAIKKAELHLEKLALAVDGTVDLFTSSSVLNLSIEGKNMDIQSACSWLPGKFKKDIEEFDSKGKFYFHTNINGTLSSSKNPEILVSAGINKAEIKQTKENLSMKDVDVQLEYSNAGKGKLTITNFSGILPEGNIKGKLALENFKDPVLNASVQGTINLTELQKFLRIDTIESITGKMKVDASFSGPIRKTAGDYLSQDQTSGELTLTDVNMKLKNNNLHFSDFNGELNLAHNDITVKSFRGKISDNDLNLDGTFKNMLAWILLKDEPLTVDVSLKSKKIDLNDLLSNKQDAVSKANPSYKLNLSGSLDLTINAAIDKLIFRKFNASLVQGTLRLKNKQIVVYPLTFNAMDGSVIAKGTLDATAEDSIRIGGTVDVKNVDVSKMFVQLENFGHESLTDKNVKGLVSAKAIVNIPCGKDLSINTNKLNCSCDVSINNGELIQFDALKSLSKFISMKELEDIKFENLSTMINIHDRIFSFPETQVNSNAIDIEVNGSQDFDGNMDYVFGLYLSELLAKKAKAGRKENTDFGEQDTEGKHRFRLYIAMKGPIKNPVISYDQKAAKEERKEVHKEEKEKLKGLLNKEFGLYKNDSLATKRNKK